jgi:OHCU decarboxylase
MENNHATPGVSERFSRDAFIMRFGGVYEHSPWVAEAVFDGGNVADDINQLARAMAAVVDGASHERQLALLRAHPDLAGRLAVRGELTQASTDEQKSAGLDQCSREELERFQSLNTEYTGKFGFPFILAVSGKIRTQILENFETRLGNSPKQEFATALGEVHKIARIRLEKLAEE